MLLRQRARVDTAVVHVLVSGLGSQPARFSAHFRRLLLTLDSIEPIVRAPPAQDADSDARLVYALAGVTCKDAQGMPMEEEACRAAFVQDGKESSVWRVNVPQKFAEALLNISVRDDAHPRELPDYGRFYKICYIGYYMSKLISVSNKSDFHRFSINCKIIQLRYDIGNGTCV